MKKVIKHIRAWNKWRKNSLDSGFHKFMVLIGLHNSPTLDFMK